MPQQNKRGQLHSRLLMLVAGLVLVSMTGSLIGLYRITEVSRSLDSINRVSIPASRVGTQLWSDVQILQREHERNFHPTRWSDIRWIAKPVPSWVRDALQAGVEKMRERLPIEDAALLDGLWREVLIADQDFIQSLERKDLARAHTLYAVYVQAETRFLKKIQDLVTDQETLIRAALERAQERVSGLRTSMQVILLVVLFLSALLLWVGERALRPLSELTRLAREITSRGLKREDKNRFQLVPLSRTDEVSQLSREFHGMATQLLERERVVEEQNQRLSDQNRELKQMNNLQERLRQAEHLAAIGRMSAQVAHEVRNPLHAIGLEAELALEIAEKEKAPTQVRQALDSILLAVARLEGITENYLKLSRMSPGKLEKLDLRDLIQEVIALYSQSCAQAEVKVEWSTSKDGPLYVRGDRSLLEQALGNLIRNSLKAMEGRPIRHLLLTAGKAESGRIYVRIQDTGPGIPPEVKARLFEPFVTGRPDGTGLGLCFVKKVLEDHQGSIHWVESSSGTCFDLLIPAFVDTLLVRESHVEPTP